MLRRTWMPAVLALGLAFTNVQGANPSPSPSKLPLVMTYKLEAAQKAFRQVWGGQGGNVERAYPWSVRWLEAERALSDQTEDRIAALEAHLERVREIEQVTKRQFQQRISSLYEVSASEYYVAEAEVWVAQAIESRAKLTQTIKRLTGLTWPEPKEHRAMPQTTSRDRGLRNSTKHL